ncbi:TonB-dependent receptor [Parasphingorhabdus cellanae]|uniref:TonB-dependent receptor n=1 Tax=Parasphingorhabdus cellanae TaxID=2806553 RepID=A0ABX7T953_9SPHN|nr:TonB-dependent receptor [Parasphingorhabdus cellanae]QTD57485.1 TonB-dependent receptor [Parasphingorhabdus cellanae]
MTDRSPPAITGHIVQADLAMRAFTGIAALAALYVITMPHIAAAQTTATAPTSSAGLQNTEPTSAPVYTDEIVVTARRYGEAQVAAESAFDEDDIAAQGTDSIQELITRLTPFIGNGAEKPALLINGRPADGDLSILSYPAEALNQLAILKPEAAAVYGYPSDKRVVNLVLKQKFASVNADAGLSWATAGGQYGGSLSVGRVAINLSTRWNVQARIERQSALLKSDRDIPPRAGSFDSVGFIASRAGEEIDPALSRAAAETVTIAAIPPAALLGVPSIADFAATANNLHSVNPNAFETLRSARRSMSFNAGVTRPLGEFSASLNINASSNSSKGLRGLPMATIALPAGSPWSPFTDDVSLSRPFAHSRALRNDNESETLGAAFNLSGRIGGWSTNFSAGYTRSWNDSLLENGIDVARIQQMVDAGDPEFNPYGPLDDDLLLASRSRSRSENISARLNLSKTIVDLPAGPLTSTYSLDVNRDQSENRQSDARGDLIAVSNQTSGRANGQMSFRVPLSQRKDGADGPMGDLSLDLSLGADALSKSGLQKKYGGSVNWSPFPLLDLRGSFDHTETAPSFYQLDGPIIKTVNRIFDFARQETVDIIQTSGGNPDLRRGSRQSLSLTTRIAPLGDQTLSLSVGYHRQIAKGGVTAFPELTPAIEAAFPERVTRDANGRLIAIDKRAINITEMASAELTSGIALRLPRQRYSGNTTKPPTPTVNPLQFSVSLNHRWRLKDELLTRPGIPAIDQLSEDGGQSRHFLSWQITLGKKGIGTSLNGSWSSTSRIRNIASDSDFHLKPPALFNFSFFLEPEHIFQGAAKTSWLNDLKLSLDIQNLFNGYRRVTDDDGSVPPGYSRDEIDPLGRTARLTVRKRF